jgi:hypothetical protein
MRHGRDPGGDVVLFASRPRPRPPLRHPPSSSDSSRLHTTPTASAAARFCSSSATVAVAAVSFATLSRLLAASAAVG